MKERLLIGTGLVLVVAAMIALNSVAFVSKQVVPDVEHKPNRSSHNAGATGTKAVYTLLAETGREVVRWRYHSADLNRPGQPRPDVFVMVGPLKRELEEFETEELLLWTLGGGRLVIIDRDPPKDLMVTTVPGTISVKKAPPFQEVGVDPYDQLQMTSGSPALRPDGETAFTTNVNAVQASRFASYFEFTPAYSAETNSGVEPEYDDLPAFFAPIASPTPIDIDGKPLVVGDPDTTGSEPENEGTKQSERAEVFSRMPISHIGRDGESLVLEVPYGDGSVIFVGDPYIVSNGGIALADNVQFAVNLLGSEGVVAFDEFHQGFGSGRNRLLEYFSGTPMIAIFLQISALVGLVFVSRSRRFARPLPSDPPDRLSNLEYISAMAELQRRTRAYDLAVENIYGDLRRRAGRLLSIDPSTISDREFAERLSERTKRSADNILRLFQDCSDIIQGGSATRSTTVELIAAIRDLEYELKLRRAAGGTR
ncbi:DUF4350 domain-containing protein [Leptolyngbya sp. 7M]|uniref:DUF4350 domain-containing protein n=1 Tax=Leptolyngbya sp. 7M TaxID=2812896 RepID=UPI001B8D0DC1|nr:DUF4350 domain-containing protein [Leptolyngbya sp. 7M]QYO65758.1 DUF4350 domain-containing protein [Leptolyngbya sp. 7M]